MCLYDASDPHHWNNSFCPSVLCSVPASADSEERLQAGDEAWGHRPAASVHVLRPHRGRGESRVRRHRPRLLQLRVGEPGDSSWPLLPSVVLQVCGYRLRLHFDGYSDCHDFWVNANSPDVHAAGWCESTGHKLHTPKGQSSHPSEEHQMENRFITILSITKYSNKRT